MNETKEIKNTTERERETGEKKQISYESATQNKVTIVSYDCTTNCALSVSRQLIV